MVRYARNTKTERNKAIALMAEQRPELSWKEIGRVFSISGQRAQQIYTRDKAKAEGGKVNDTGKREG